MKKNYTAFDMIRQEKFKSPEKIRKVENLLKEKEIVINWWCRQSGKTLTGIKISRDFAFEVPNSKVVVIVPNRDAMDQWMEMKKRTIDRKRVHSHTKNSIRLDNGSLIIVTCKEVNLKDANLIVVDEFEYVDKILLSSVIRHARLSLKMGTVDKILSFFKKTAPCKFLFSSTSKNGESFKILKESLPSSFVNYLNWDSLKIDFSHLKDILTEEEFKREYDSYKP